MFASVKVGNFTYFGPLILHNSQLAVIVKQNCMIFRNSGYPALLSNLKYACFSNNSKEKIIVKNFPLQICEHAKNQNI